MTFFESEWKKHGRDTYCCYRLTCGRCGAVFSAARHDTKYCGGACRQAAYRERVTDKPSADICTT